MRAGLSALATPNDLIEWYEAAQIGPVNRVVAREVRSIVQSQ